MDEIKPHLIVGLGNPGPAYAFTRHNIGFMVVDRLVRKCELASCGQRDDAVLHSGRIADIPVVAARPMTYMNRSGGPVGDIVRTHGIQFEDMVVIHDDIDLAYERLKIKEKGGDGGHNGLRSLIDALGTDDFVRVRMGVGRPEADIGVVDYVLGEFDASQRSTLEPFLSRAIEAARAILCEGAKEAMNRFNRKP
ncbi:peptidyl-tRNA hydrolase [Desulfosarcina alkanivorans]|uniref:Peptidyl-tRNA hydrolase n=1 Tax=Desulfosarcina alkanivorans TaxID=571177 RepID=A0A5K7YTV1_9BACT|nr:aminoacyl-tRNA hydrolase [Desulfosarcina alkanivorans]BBO71720.1 peptidyl-tRNA hydrolase [Desulfosarcina alkanivorans]